MRHFQANPVVNLVRRNGRCRGRDRNVGRDSNVLHIAAEMLVLSSVCGDIEGNFIVAVVSIRLGKGNIRAGACSQVVATPGNLRERPGCEEGFPVTACAGKDFGTSTLPSFFGGEGVPLTATGAPRDRTALVDDRVRDLTIPLGPATFAENFLPFLRVSVIAMWFRRKQGLIEGDGAAEG